MAQIFGSFVSAGEKVVLLRHEAGIRLRRILLTPVRSRAHGDALIVEAISDLFSELAPEL